MIDIQRNLGSDIMMPLDICTPYPSTQKDVESDMVITHRWGAEALEYCSKIPIINFYLAWFRVGVLRIPVKKVRRH